MHNRTYHIITIGCQMNKSDSERVAGYLERHGFESVDKPERAGLVVINTCGVRQSAEDRIYGLVPEIRRSNPDVKIILTGCLSERKDIKRKLGDQVDIWLPIRDLPMLAGRLEAASCRLYETDYLDIIPKYTSSISAFVPIGNGCDNFCTYCAVPYARGREVYRSAEEIVDEIKGLVGKGYREINLIAQNVNSYKSQIPNPKSQTNSKFEIQNSKQLNFSGLLRIVNDIPGDFWIRFATSHPKDMSDELIKAVAECDKACEHIHLPVQAGDDEVLANMNRQYTVDDYKKLIKKIRDGLPGVSISTDVIVGFPGETEEQFKNTVRLFEEMKFDLAYIAQYSPRPGTAAAKLTDNVSKEEKKRREKVLTGILRRTALENNKKYLNQTVEVLIEGTDKKNRPYGKTRTNKNVKCQSFQPKTGPPRAENVKVNAGGIVKVSINRARDFGLEGNVV